MPLIKSRMGAGLKYYSIEKGLAGGAPDAPAAYVAACDLVCDSVEAYQSSFGPYAQEIRADIRNFTDQTPVVQISEVVVENSVQRLELSATPSSSGLISQPLTQFKARHARATGSITLAAKT